MTYAANDEVLITGGYDQAVKVWDCRSRNYDAIQSLKPFADSVTCVAAGAADITAASVDGTVRRFDIRMGLAYIDAVHHPITSLALSRDGLSVLLACLDSTLRLLDRSSGTQLAAYTGHVHSAVKMDCCLTPSEAHVVGSSETGAARPRNVRLTPVGTCGVRISSWKGGLGEASCRLAASSLP